MELLTTNEQPKQRSNLKVHVTVLDAARVASSELSVHQSPATVSTEMDSPAAHLDNVPGISLCCC